MWTQQCCCVDPTTPADGAVGLTGHVSWPPPNDTHWYLWMSGLPCVLQVGLVSQEPTLFQTTIYENIALGRPGATEQEVIEAAERANAHRFISNMPARYSTQVRA